MRHSWDGHGKTLRCAWSHSKDPRGSVIFKINRLSDKKTPGTDIFSSRYLQGKWMEIYLQIGSHQGEGLPLPCPSSFHRSESLTFLWQKETLPLSWSPADCLSADLSFVTRQLFWDTMPCFFPMPPGANSVGWGIPSTAVILHTTLAPCSVSHHAYGVMATAWTSGKS